MYNFLGLLGYDNYSVSVAGGNGYPFREDSDIQIQN